MSEHNNNTHSDAHERDNHYISIVVNDVELGYINPRTIKARAQFDIEAAISGATPASDLLRWLVTYAHVKEDDIARIREELAEMEAWRLVELLISIQEAVGKALTLPKVYKQRSISR